MNVKRSFDLLLLLITCPLTIFLFLVVYLLLVAQGQGSALYWSDRIGKNGVIFSMPKFRSMLPDTPAVATDLLEEPNKYITPIGAFLRKTSIDELPQLISILKGEMSFVGPRPALFNQYELIQMRETYGVQRCLPGLTGWAQINGRDELSDSEKLLYDKFYCDNLGLMFDIVILVRTFALVARHKGVSH